MDLFGIRLSVDTPVKKLDIVQRIELEILKAWLLKHQSFFWIFAVFIFQRKNFKR